MRAQTSSAPLGSAGQSTPPPPPLSSTSRAPVGAVLSPGSRPTALGSPTAHKPRRGAPLSAAQGSDPQVANFCCLAPFGADAGREDLRETMLPPKPGRQMSEGPTSPRSASLGPICCHPRSTSRCSVGWSPQGAAFLPSHVCVILKLTPQSPAGRAVLLSENSSTAVNIEDPGRAGARVSVQPTQWHRALYVALQPSALLKPGASSGILGQSLHSS